MLKKYRRRTKKWTKGNLFSGGSEALFAGSIPAPASYPLLLGDYTDSTSSGLRISDKKSDNIRRFPPRLAAAEMRLRLKHGFSTLRLDLPLHPRPSSRSNGYKVNPQLRRAFTGKKGKARLVDALT